MYSLYTWKKLKEQTPEKWKPLLHLFYFISYSRTLHVKQNNTVSAFLLKKRVLHYILNLIYKCVKTFLFITHVFQLHWISSTKNDYSILCCLTVDTDCWTNLYRLASSNSWCDRPKDHHKQLYTYLLFIHYMHIRFKLNPYQKYFCASLFHPKRKTNYEFNVIYLFIMYYY